MTAEARSFSDLIQHIQVKEIKLYLASIRRLVEGGH
jgi:hypothetical protein